MRQLYEAKLAEISLQIEALATVRQEIEQRLADLDGTTRPEQES